jgi:hypothetical protein
MKNGGDTSLPIKGRMPLMAAKATPISLSRHIS